MGARRSKVRNRSGDHFSWGSASSSSTSSPRSRTSAGARCLRFQGHQADGGGGHAEEVCRVSRLEAAGYAFGTDQLHPDFRHDLVRRRCEYHPLHCRSLDSGTFIVAGHPPSAIEGIATLSAPTSSDNFDLSSSHGSTFAKGMSSLTTLPFVATSRDYRRFAAIVEQQPHHVFQLAPVFVRGGRFP